MKREVWMMELGYFCKEDVERIAQKMEGKTFFNFHVIYSNYCGNYSLGVEVSIDRDETDDEIKSMFLNTALGML